MLRFAQSMTRLSCRLLGASVPFELPVDEETDELLESSLWDIPSATTGGKSLFQRRLGIISNLLHARRRYKVFYDTSSLGMIIFLFCVVWIFIGMHILRKLGDIKV